MDWITGIEYWIGMTFDLVVLNAHAWSGKALHMWICKQKIYVQDSPLLLSSLSPLPLLSPGLHRRLASVIVTCKNREKCLWLQVRSLMMCFKRTDFSNYNHELFYFFRCVMEQLDSESDNVELDSPCLMLRYD